MSTRIAKRTQILRAVKTALETPGYFKRVYGGYIDPERMLTPGACVFFRREDIGTGADDQSDRRLELRVLVAVSGSIDGSGEAVEEALAAAEAALGEDRSFDGVVDITLDGAVENLASEDPTSPRAYAMLEYTLVYRRSRTDPYVTV